MKTSPKTFTKPAVFLALLLFALPSSAQAWGEFDDLPDETLTISVDLPATPGDGDSSGCNGYSSLTISTNSLDATLDEIIPGVANPTMLQKLSYWFGDIDAVEDFTFTNSASQVVSVFTEVEEDIYSFNEEWAAGEGQYSIQYFDTNGDDLVSSDDLFPSMLTYRVFASDPFDVSFDIDSCIDSGLYGFVEVSRMPLSKWVDGGWEFAEFEFGEDINYQDLQAIDNAWAGNSYLFRLTQIGGYTFDPFFAEYTDEWDTILEGPEGTTTLRSVTRLFGDDSNGQYRQKFGFWMYVD